METETIELVKKVVAISIVVLVGGALAGGLFAGYEFYMLDHNPTGSSGTTVTPAPVEGLRTIQQVQEKSLQGSSTVATPQVLDSIQQAQLKAQQQNGGTVTGTSGGSSDISPQQQAELQAIQEAQLKAQQSNGSK